jgi:hypothetical protein
MQAKRYSRYAPSGVHLTGLACLRKEGTRWIPRQELGPYEPVPDVLVLAAIERVITHSTDTAWIVGVAKHLGFSAAPTTPATANGATLAPSLRSG